MPNPTIRKSREHVLDQINSAKTFITNRLQNNEPNREENEKEFKRLQSLHDELKWFNNEY